MNISIKISIIILIGAIVLGGLLIFNQSQNKTTNPVTTSTSQIQSLPLTGSTAVMYKHTGCGCCAGHQAALEEAGMQVEVIELPSVAEKKKEYGVLPSQGSCHTLVVNDGQYVVEGHVPVEGVVKLLNEEPDIPGIALAGMPIGTPGMPGPKTQDYIVQVIGSDEVFATY